MTERSVDTRIGITRILNGMPKQSVALSSYLTSTLPPLFVKETNESALATLIDALMAHQAVLLRNDSASDDKISKLVSSGLTDKRAKVKSAWVVAVSNLVWDVNEPSNANPSIIAFSRSVAKGLFGAFTEVANNAVQAMQNGTITSGYAAAAATIGRWLDWQGDLAQMVKSDGILKASVAVTPKPSFILNDRIYTKLANEKDQLWAVNALEAIGRQELLNMGIAWSTAVIFFVSNPKLAKDVRFAAKAMIAKVLNTLPPGDQVRGAEILILGVEDWIRQVEEG
jgi:hypothetical protein